MYLNQEGKCVKEFTSPTRMNSLTLLRSLEFYNSML